MQNENLDKDRSRWQDWKKFYDETDPLARDVHINNFSVVSVKDLKEKFNHHAVVAPFKTLKKGDVVKCFVALAERDENDIYFLQGYEVTVTIIFKNAGWIHGRLENEFPDGFSLYKGRRMDIKAECIVAGQVSNPDRN